MQANEVTNAASTPEPDTKRAPLHAVADQLKHAADLIEIESDLVEVMHDLLKRIHADLIATSGSVSVETAELLGAFLSDMEGGE